MTHSGSEADLQPTTSAATPDVGIALLYLLLVLQPFHYKIAEWFLYYRECFAALFLLLWLKDLCLRLQKPYVKMRLPREAAYLLLFGLFLILAAAIDPHNDLYLDDMTDASAALSTIPPDIYIIRNAFIYLPMFLYIAGRGLSGVEVKHIAQIVSFVAPLSILGFLTHYELATVFNIGSIVSLGGVGLQYNSYVPYLTFPVIATMFLLTTNTSMLGRLLYVFNLCALSLYIYVSTSRQSLCFVILAGILFLLRGRWHRRAGKAAGLMVLAGVAFVLVKAIDTRAETSQIILDKLGSAKGFTETLRLEIFLDGLDRLKGTDYIVGAGLSSVVAAGPHNDYLRWVQRVGVFGMMIGFAPFVRGLRRAYRAMRKNKKSSLRLFLWLGVLFTVYHSLFGYPREDAYQSLYCFLGLAMWLGFRQTKGSGGRYDATGRSLKARWVAGNR